MSEDRLSRVVEDFNYRNLNLFFRSKCENFAEAPGNLSQYDDERFNDFQKLGEIRFDNGDKLVITASLVIGGLSERTGKKAQYDKAKKILRELAVYDAGFFIYHDNSGNFRFSLIYGQAEGTKKSWSNFRRFTYLVSQDQTNKTFRMRVGECIFSSLENVKDAFSVEKVNKEFYNHIAEFFYRLTGYDRKREMKLPSVSDDDKKTYQEFAVRLIGRTIFCWFLKHKKSVAEEPLVPKGILSSDSVYINKGYYHNVLEKLFFEVLNTPQEQRKEDILPDADRIPFLNGGLFEPHKVNDFYNGQPQYNLVIPDDWFEQFFGILEQYNFTIDENSSVDADVSVDPEMLGRIFENLLAEVNPETGETARKSTGSYYTPRTIVDYMVDQSLKRYLVAEAGIDENTVNGLLSYEDPDSTLTDREKNTIIAALDEIKIIDPACGSGAFPMGILHKILLILEKIDPEMKLWFKQKFGSIDDALLKQEIVERLEKENWEYIRKLLIIRKSIYGVDIQTIAVEISKLRFFLSLIVDEKIDDKAKYRGVKPLPNLEFKFVAANSLIKLPTPDTNKKALIDFEDTESIKDLAKIRDKYFTSYGADKIKAEQEFSATQKKMFEFYLQNLNQEQRNLIGAVKKINNNVGKTVTQMLSEWEPFTFKQCDWFDSKWMFGVTDNFDIVIGNPPYLRVQGIQQTQPEYMSYYRDNYQSAKGNFDLYALFIERGYQLLNSKGQFAYIVPHKFFQASFGEALRRFLTKRGALREVVRFGSAQVFEESTTYTCLLFLGAEHGSSFDMLEVKTLDRGEEVLQAARTRTKHPDYAFEPYPEPAISQNSKSIEWDFSIGEDKRIVERLQQHSLTLADVTRKIFVGLQTSADKIYVLKILDEYTDSLLCYSNYFEEEVEIERGLVKLFLMGKDVHRYEPAKARNVVIFPYIIRNGRLS
ncbi:putative type IIS restriction [Dehalococcoides mccartyi]|uniref:site-specific DNA-methyltransferase (adenine-specific) n=1 Tax=Dehalococcoides mccartyi TaxID=61435 RepID=A0A328EJW7_9CHLR|nr:putative type IIS restriction [Dehalococcoides mccartyi]